MNPEEIPGVRLAAVESGDLNRRDIDGEAELGKHALA